MVKTISQSVRWIRTSLLLGLLIGVFGCDSGISDKNLSFVLPQDAALMMREGKNSLIGPDQATIVVDPRPSWSYRKSHIPGSINIPFGRLSNQAWRLDQAGIIIVAGETYNDSVAIGMSKALLSMGFTDVKTLRGGLLGWGDAGESIETAE
jgi:rhodanese-related sulfurtransferase